MRRAWVIILLVFAWVLPAFGQEPSTQTPAHAAEQFMAAAASRRWEDAVKWLDIRGLPEADRDTAARVAAQDLAWLLEDMRFAPAAMPLDGIESPLVINRIKNESGDVVGEIQLELRQGVWLFGPETVAKASDMARVQRRLKETASETGTSGDSNAPPSVRSPRATVTTFFEAMNDERAADAITTLDLSELNPLVRQDRGMQIANRLFAILNRTQVFDLETIPDSASGTTYTLASYRKADGTFISDIQIGRNEEDSWQFTKETIASLDAIWAEVESKPVIAGLKDVDLSKQDPSYVIRTISPESWMRPVAPGVAIWQLAWGFIFLAFAAIWGLIGAGIIAIFIRFKFKHESAAIPMKVLKRLRLAVMSVLAFWFLDRAALRLNFSEQLAPIVQSVIRGILTIACVMLVGILWDAAINVIGHKLESKSRRSNTLFIPVVRQFGFLLIGGVAILILLARFGVNVTGVVAGLGIGGAILALAAKDSVENVFGSMTILFEAPFEIGDWVKVDGIEGNVEEITLRSTRIRTFADSLVVMPNSTLITTPVENFGRRRMRRLKTTIGISYDTKPQVISEFVQRIKKLLENREDVVQHKRNVGLTDMNESTLDILVSTYLLCDTYDAELLAREEILRGIMEIAQEMKIEFAFPTRTLIVQQGEAIGTPATMDS